MRVLVPDRIARLEIFEILREPGAIEAPVAEIAQESRHPHAAEEAAGRAGRIDPGFTSPIGQRRAVEYRRAGERLAFRRQQRDGPTCLAIAIEHRRLSRVARAHRLDETAPCV